MNLLFRIDTGDGSMNYGAPFKNRYGQAFGMVKYRNLLYSDAYREICMTVL